MPPPNDRTQGATIPDDDVAAERWRADARALLEQAVKVWRRASRDQDQCRLEATISNSIDAVVIAADALVLGATGRRPTKTSPGRALNVIAASRKDDDVTTAGAQVLRTVVRHRSRKQPVSGTDAAAALLASARLLNWAIGLLSRPGKSAA